MSVWSAVNYLFYVVAENGQVNDVKNMVVSPGTGIDLEFDSDSKYFLWQCMLFCLLRPHIFQYVASSHISKIDDNSCYK